MCNNQILILNLSPLRPVVIAATPYRYMKE